MTGSLAIYGIVVGSFFAGAAFFLDRSARALRLPSRWIWLAGMVGGTVAPFLPGLFRNFRSEPGAAGPIPAEYLYYLTGPYNFQGQSSGSSAGLFDQPLLLLWVLASLTILLEKGGRSGQWVNPRSWYPKGSARRCSVFSGPGSCYRPGPWSWAGKNSKSSFFTRRSISEPGTLRPLPSGSYWPH